MSFLLDFCCFEMYFHKFRITYRLNQVENGMLWGVGMLITCSPLPLNRMFRFYINRSFTADRQYPQNSYKKRVRLGWMSLNLKGVYYRGYDMVSRGKDNKSLACKRPFLWISKKSWLMRSAGKLQNFITNNLPNRRRRHGLKYCRYGIKHKTINQIEV